MAERSHFLHTLFGLPPQHHWRISARRSLDPRRRHISQLSSGPGRVPLELDNSRDDLGVHRCHLDLRHGHRLHPRVARFLVSLSHPLTHARARTLSFSLKLLLNFRAIYHVMGTSAFWLCLLAILVVGMIPRFTLKSFLGYVAPNDILIGREIEKFRATATGGVELEMTAVAGRASARLWRFP